MGEKMTEKELLELYREEKEKYSDPMSYANR